MKIVPWFLKFMFVALMTTFVVSAEVNLSKNEDIQKMLAISGSVDAAKQMANQLFAQMQQAWPQVPRECWKELKSEFAAMPIVDLIGVYDKHFSHDEIKELIKFYQSPIGQRFIKELPAVTQESMQIGQEWGKEIAAKVWDKIQKKGLEVE